jgi:hypothetical protein
MKRQIIGFIIGFLINLSFFFICIQPYSKEHEKIFFHTIIFVMAFISVAVVPLFFSDTRPYAIGGLIALVIPLLIFLAIQALVILSYWFS